MGLGEPPDLYSDAPPHTDDDDPRPRRRAKVRAIRPGIEVGADGPAPFERGDHVELAVRLLARCGEGASLVYTDGALHRARAALPVYARVERGECSQVVQEFAGATVGTGEKPGTLRVRASDVAGAIALARDRLEDAEFFTRAPAGMAFGAQFVEASAAGLTVTSLALHHRARWAYPFPFVSDAVPGRVLAFLADVFRDDEDAEQKIRLVQEVGGLALVHRGTLYQRVVALVGDGANGKSVLLQVLEAAMPTGSTCSIPPQDWADEYRLAMLAGKLLNVVAELPERDIIEAERFKAVVAGDSLTARPIREAPFAMRPCAAHVVAANRLPGTADQSHAFWRRFVVVRFNRVYATAEQNPHLARELCAELPALVPWLLAGAVRALQQGALTEPASSAQAIEEWRLDADQVAAFVADCCDPLGAGETVASGERAEDVYRRYKTWAAINGHRGLLASNSFGARLKRRGYVPGHTNTGNRYPLRLRGGVDLPDA